MHGPPSSGKGPPSSSRHRREDILKAATQLFAERGYEGASMADLAERVGLRKASLFHHFPSKDALYMAVLERIIERLGEVLVQAMTSEGNYLERIDIVTDCLIDAMGEEPAAARLVLREVMDWGPYARQRFAQTALPVLRAGEEFLLAGQREGVFAKRDAQHIVLTICALYLLPFASEQVVRSLTGLSPFEPAFLEARKRELRAQAHGIIVA